MESAWTTENLRLSLLLGDHRSKDQEKNEQVCEQNDKLKK